MIIAGRRFIRAWLLFWRLQTPERRLAFVARETLDHLDAHLCLVSRPLADELRVWSEPVQHMIEPGRDGLVELIARVCEPERRTA